VCDSDFRVPTVFPPCDPLPWAEWPVRTSRNAGHAVSAMRLELTRRADYGIRAMIAIARADLQEPMSTPRIADAMAIPIRFLPQVMADLARAGLVDSTGGRRGGYRLARPAASISLLQMIEALEGDARRRQCVLRSAPCGLDGHCDVHLVFASAQESLLDRFSHTSLSELAAPSRDGAGRGLAGRSAPPEEVQVAQRG
jgi:Rrf2 family iron-sulfur cluster assembly transcriptional regulator